MLSFLGAGSPCHHPPRATVHECGQGRTGPLARAVSPWILALEYEPAVRPPS